MWSVLLHVYGIKCLCSGSHGTRRKGDFLLHLNLPTPNLFLTIVVVALVALAHCCHPGHHHQERSTVPCSSKRGRGKEKEGKAETKRERQEDLKIFNHFKA